MTNQLPSVIQRHIDAINAFDTDAVVATFAADALVNDNHRDIRGTDAIRAWVAREIVGDRVTMDVVAVVDQPGVSAVRARYDGDFDRTGLPDEVILTNYFVVRDDRIAALFVIFNTADHRAVN
jgi:hypothetical protein